MEYNKKDDTSVALDTYDTQAQAFYNEYCLCILIAESNNTALAIGAALFNEAFVKSLVSKMYSDEIDVPTGHFSKRMPEGSARIFKKTTRSRESISAIFKHLVDDPLPIDDEKNIKNNLKALRQRQEEHSKVFHDSLGKEHQPVTDKQQQENFEKKQDPINKIKEIDTASDLHMHIVFIGCDSRLHVLLKVLRSPLCRAPDGTFQPVVIYAEQVISL